MKHDPWYLLGILFKHSKSTLVLFIWECPPDLHTHLSYIIWGERYIHQFWRFTTLCVGLCQTAIAVYNKWSEIL